MSAVPRSAYFAWNDAIASRFFCPDAAQQPVYLYVTEDILNELGAHLGGGIAEYLDVVRAGPPGTTRSGHCQRALQVAQRWRHHANPYPPYIAYLSLFVLAGGHEGDFDPRSYYPRLWDLLGEAGEGTPPSFDRMWELWYDLEQWSVTDQHGDLGLFKARVAGEKIHIGLPLAQTMLTEEERRGLPAIFAAARLEPGTPPSDRELGRAMTVHGRASLRRRTLRALEGGATSFRDGLLEVVSDDFEEWDGEAPAIAGRHGARRQVTAGLRLCLSIDRVARAARTSIRIRSKREFPEVALAFQSASAEGVLTCQEYAPGWSGPLVSAAAGAEFVPPSPAWKDGVVLTDRHSGWTVRLHPANVRIFIDGRADQLPGLIETYQIQRSQPFYLAFAQTVVPRLQRWIDDDCAGWRPIELTQGGFPTDWVFGAVDEARADRALRSIDDRLGFPDRRTVRLVGGIPADVRSTYFAFAPPRVVVEGMLPDDALRCQGSPLTPDEAVFGSFTLPARLPVDARIEVEVWHSEEVVMRRSLYLVSGVGWRISEPEVVLDPYGRPAHGEGEGISGADVPFAPGSTVPLDLLRTPGLSPRAPRVFFVGPQPGQIVVWPEEALPSWDPVWAVEFGRHGRALFCGATLEPPSSRTGRFGDRAHLKLWHTVLWDSRKRITPPDDHALKALWRKYNEAARVA